MGQTHAPSESFTIQLRMPVYILKNGLDFTLRKKTHATTDLRIETTNLVLHLGNRRKVFQGVTNFFKIELLDNFFNKFTIN